MKVKNLFGEIVETAIPKNQSKYQRFRSMNRYRVSDGKNKCRNCDHLIKFEYHNKNYYKC